MKKWQYALQLTGMGFYVGICIVLGVVVGRWLDSRFETSPLLVLVGLFVGLLLAGYGVYQMLRPLLINNNNKDKKHVNIDVIQYNRYLKI